MAERSHSSVEEAVYWYNVTPKDSCTESTAPGAQAYRYRMRVRPAAANDQSSDVDGSVQQGAARNSGGSYEVGDAVWVRRRGSRCVTRSEMGTVTAVVSDLCVEVDGVPRHIRNLRPRQQRRHNSDDERSRHEGVALDEETPLLITLPALQQSAETSPSLQPPRESAPAERERTVFTLPSRSAARCLRAVPPRRQLY